MKSAQQAVMSAIVESRLIEKNCPIDFVEQRHRDIESSFRRRFLGDIDPFNVVDLESLRNEYSTERLEVSPMPLY
jgi:hypothetical protein